jgi:hypothetical protein
MDRHWRRRVHRPCVSDLSGPCAHQRLAEEAEEMRREELRTLHDNVYLFDDWRRKPMSFGKPFQPGRAKTAERRWHRLMRPDRCGRPESQ